MSETMTTVDALTALREMFPEKAIFLKDEVEWWNEDREPCRAVVIGIDYPPSRRREFTGDTLNEVMAEIRVWKASQS